MKLYNLFFKNARSLILKSNYFVNSYSDIDSLNTDAIIIDNKDQIVINDRVPISIQISLENPYKTYYVANKLYADKMAAIINEFEENDTTLFIVPMLEVDPRLILIESNFINGYIAHGDHFSNLGDCVYLIYRYMPFNQYRNLLSILAKQPNFISYEKASDKRFDIIKMKIPERFKDSVKLIFEGKYIEIPKHAKHSITKFRQRKKDDIIYQTLFNSDKLRETMAYNLGVSTNALPENLREKPNLKKETW